MIAPGAIGSVGTSSSMRTRSPAWMAGAIDPLDTRIGDHPSTRVGSTTQKARLSTANRYKSAPNPAAVTDHRRVSVADVPILSPVVCASTDQLAVDTDQVKSMPLALAPCSAVSATVTRKWKPWVSPVPAGVQPVF